MTPKQEGETLTTFGKETPTGAREVAARLVELEGLAAGSMLRFYNQPLALASMEDLVRTGAPVDELPAAMRRMRAHPDFRSKRHPPQLHDWLRQRVWIGWLEDEAVEAVAAAGPAEAEASPHAAPAADQALWAAAMAEMRVIMGEAEFGSYLGRAWLGLGEGRLYVVAGSAVARDHLKARRWRQVETAWRGADAGKRRPLTLVSKLEFEALVGRHGEGVE